MEAVGQVAMVVCVAIQIAIAAALYIGIFSDGIREMKEIRKRNSIERGR